MKKSGVLHKNDNESGGIKQHWKDEVHEADGTNIRSSSIGMSDYTKDLQMSMDMLVNSNGQLTAWGDVTNTELDPKGVAEARQLEMK